MGMIYRTASVFFRAATRLWWATQKRTPPQGDNRRVLFYVTSQLMADALVDVCQLIKDDPRINCSLATPWKHDNLFTPGPVLASLLGIPYVSHIAARATRWDMVFLADPSLHHSFHPDIPRILTNHSLTGGKISHGENTRYGERNTMMDGKPIFARMFEASETTCRAAIAGNPQLEGHIAVVGDLRTDRLLDNLAHRDRIRAGFGFEPTDTVVLIQSTWGDHSLLNTRGADLLAQAKELATQGNLRFLISIHPNDWKPTRPWSQRILEYECPGLVVLRPDQRWETFMPAADVAITDHTANAAAFALLKKPMLFVPLPPGVVLEQSIEWKLYTACPKITDYQGIEQAVEITRQMPPNVACAAILPEILSYPGEAAHRVRSELYSVLNLDLPITKS